MVGIPAPKERLCCISVDHLNVWWFILFYLFRLRIAREAETKN